MLKKKGKKKNQAPFKHLIAENVNEINNQREQGVKVIGCILHRQRVPVSLKVTKKKKKRRQGKGKMGEQERTVKINRGTNDFTRE